MNQEKDKSQVLLFISIAILLVYITPSLFTFPVADDLTYAAKSRSAPLFEAWKNEYLNWNGRYFSDLLDLLNPAAINSLWLYRGCLALGVVMTPLVLSNLLKTLAFPSTSGQRRSFAVLISLLYFNLMPDIAEGLYWYSAMVTYHVGNLLFVLHISFALRFLKSKKLHHSVLSFAFLICAIGSNEVLMVYALLLPLLALIVFKKENNKQFLWTIISISISIICAFAVILSPGNSGRSSHFTENHDFLHSAGMSALQTIRFSIRWILSPALLFASVLFLKLFNAEYIEWKWTVRKRLIVLSSLLAFFIFSASFIPYWATGILGQHRTINTALFFFLPAWLGLLLTIKKSGAFNNFLQKPMNLNVLFIGLALSLLLTRNGYLISTDLFTGRLRAYSLEMKERAMLLSSARDMKDGTITLPKLSVRPESVFILDISPDSTDWMNRGYVLYYELGNKKIVAGTK